MENEAALLLAAILLTITALSMLVINDWRLSLILLSLQYTGMFLLLSTQWAGSMAAVKIIAGWMAAAVLGLAVSADPAGHKALYAYTNSFSDAQSGGPAKNTRPSLGVVFRFFAAGLFLLTLASSLLSPIPILAGIEPTYLWGGFVLLGLGILKLSLTSHPFHIILSLLTMLSGFEILYGALDKTVISAGLLSTVTLAIALNGAYLLNGPSMEPDK